MAEWNQRKLEAQESSGEGIVLKVHGSTTIAISENYLHKSFIQLRISSHMILNDFEIFNENLFHNTNIHKPPMVTTVPVTYTQNYTVHMN